MRKNRSRKEEEAYERLMKQQEKLKKNQAVQKTEGSQKYVAAGNKSAYEAGQNSVGSGRQGWIREKNGGIRLQPRKTKERNTGAGSSGKRPTGSPGNSSGVLRKGKGSEGKYVRTWVNTARPGGGTEIWKQVALNPGETAADYYEKKRKEREADRQETDAALRRALEETQEELREQRLGVAEGFGRKKRYNQNYEDLFGLPEEGDFRSRVERKRGPRATRMK